MKLKVLGVCAGNGVCLYPFKNSKFKILGNIEPRSVFYDKGNRQWNSNFEGILQYKSKAGVVIPKYILRLEPDIMIGHPDCGHASILRLSRAKKNVSAKGNYSLDHYLESVLFYQPKVWLMENLPGLLKTYSEADFKERFLDYHLKFHISSVAAYGNSQVSRERLVIVGIRKDLGTKGFFKLPDYSSLIKNSENFELGDSENLRLGHVREPLAKTCNLYWGSERKITYALAESIWNTTYRDKSRWAVNGKMKNQPGVSKNMPGKPPFTTRKQNRQFGTTGLVLSPREMASIQGLPLDFKLYIDKSDKIYWLNKSRLTVTKSMPYEIANWFAKKAYKTLKQA